MDLDTLLLYVLCIMLTQSRSTNYTTVEQPVSAILYVMYSRYSSAHNEVFSVYYSYIPVASSCCQQC